MSGICSLCSLSSCATTTTIVPTARLSWARRYHVRQCRAAWSSVDRSWADFITSTRGRHELDPLLPSHSSIHSVRTRSRCRRLRIRIQSRHSRLAPTGEESRFEAGSLQRPARLHQSLGCDRRRERGKRRRADYPAVIFPNNPWDSPSGPAVKNSVVVGPLFALPLPNWSDQRPSIVSILWSPVRTWPTSS